jgi:short-subunit dehydrogenase
MKNLIIVTGGTKGIGKAVIREFADKGFDVVTCSRKESDLIKLSKVINNDFPDCKVHYKVVDLSQKSQVNDFVDFIKSLNRKVDVLLNNAGLYVPGQVHNEPDGNLEFMINTNLYSAYYLTRGLIGEMMERKSGHIFNLCSTASITPYVNGGSYCISKFALLGMSKVLREEMKPFNVKVTSILPGATLTASWEGVDLPPERFMKSEDIAQVIWTAYSLSGSAVMEEVLLRPQLGDIS